MCAGYRTGRRKDGNLCAGLCETEETDVRQVLCTVILIFVQVPVGDNEVIALHKVSSKLISQTEPSSDACRHRKLLQSSTHQKLFWNIQTRCSN